MCGSSGHREIQRLVLQDLNPRLRGPPRGDDVDEAFGDLRRVENTAVQQDRIRAGKRISCPRLSQRGECRFSVGAEKGRQVSRNRGVLGIGQTELLDRHASPALYLTPSTPSP